MSNNSKNNEKEQPFISVIIPTYHDWERLQLCLDALVKQTYPKDNFEILVVNNDPEDQAPAGLALPENCTLLEEPKPGSYAARNKAVSKARGKVLSFTDSDCIPDKYWLTKISEYYAEGSGVLTGHVQMFSTLNKKSLNFTESYDYIFGINQEIYAEKKTGATANLSVLKVDFDTVSGFRSDMFSGGDIDFCNRAVLQGVDFNFDSSVFVNHPLRSDLNQLVVKTKRLAGGKVYKNKFKGLFINFMPPLVRLKILFFKKEASVVIKFKCFLMIMYVKLVQIVAAINVFLGKEKERL